MKLSQTALNAGFRLECFASLGSTNDEAMRRARSGDPGRLWIIADEQTAGRGRHGRNWSSPRGNLFASLLLIDPAPPSLAPELGFVAGVSLATTLEKLLGGDGRLRLKWPNDVLYSGAKLSGILLEGADIGHGRFACVIGFGVNCVSHPEGLAYRATDLSALHAPSDRVQIFAELSANIEKWLGRWAGGAGFAEIRSLWLGFAAGLDEPIRVALGARQMEGVFKTIDARGRLVLETETGPATVDAGDVFLLGPSGSARPAVEGRV